MKGTWVKLTGNATDLDDDELYWLSIVDAAYPYMVWGFLGKLVLVLAERYFVWKNFRGFWYYIDH